MVLKTYSEHSKTVNEQAGFRKLNPEQLDLITGIGYRRLALQLNNMRDSCQSVDGLRLNRCSFFS